MGITATTKCYFDSHALDETVERYDSILESSVCPHISSNKNGAGVWLYVVMDSGCLHRSSDHFECDKGMGDWVHIVAKSDGRGLTARHLRLQLTSYDRVVQFQNARDDGTFRAQLVVPPPYGKAKKSTYGTVSCRIRKNVGPQITRTTICAHCTGTRGEEGKKFNSKTYVQVAIHAADTEDAANSGRPVSSILSPQEEFDIFLAHNSADKNSVQLVAEALRKRGLKPWLDSEQIPPGRWFQDVLQCGARHSGCAAVFIGPAGLGRWQAIELRTFISQCVEHSVPVIPVLLPGVLKVPDSLVFLRELSQVSFDKSVLEPDRIDLLEWAIKGEKPC